MVQNTLPQQGDFVALKISVVGYFSRQFKSIDSLHPVVQAHVPGDRIQSTTVHHCIRAKNHTGGVHNVDLSVGQQRALDVGWGPAQDSVQDG